MIELRNQVGIKNHISFVQFTMFDKFFGISFYLTLLVLQCRIIRTTELATAQEKLNELERQKEEILKFYSPGSLLHKLQGNLYNHCNASSSLQFLCHHF